MWNALRAIKLWQVGVLVVALVGAAAGVYFGFNMTRSSEGTGLTKDQQAKLDGMRKDRWSKLETAPIDSGDVKDHPYLPQFQAFVDAVQEDREMPHTSLDDAARTHRVVFAADRSSALGRTVKLPELPA